MKKITKYFMIIFILVMIVGLHKTFESYNNTNLNNILAINYEEDMKYKVLFDASYGELVGFENFVKVRDGLYGWQEGIETILNENTNLSARNGNYILYWSKDHLCSTRDLEVNGSFNTQGHTVYYACYEQTNFDKNGIRYVQNNAYVDGENVNCGDIIKVTKCYKQANGGINDITDYCEFEELNGKKASGKVYRNSLAIAKPNTCSENTYTAYFHETPSSTGLNCDNITNNGSGLCTSSAREGDKVFTPNTTDYVFNGKKFIGWASDDDGKNINCSGELVTSATITLKNDVHYYSCYEDNSECKNSEKIINGKGQYEVKVCYNAQITKNNKLSVVPISDSHDKILTCANGYTLDNVSESNIIETNCKNSGKCYAIYNLNCVGERPKISAATSVVEGNYGTINFKASSSAGIKGYYASTEYKKPTKNTKWIYDSSGNYHLSAKPGAVFLWVIDNNNQISYAAMTSVVDKINVDTTLKTLEIKNSNGETLNASKYSYNYDNRYNGISSSDYVRLSNDLEGNSPILAKGFDPFISVYKITTTSSKIAVYASLTSDDAKYVKGYEPRTVELDYGINTILIKIQNKKGKERTYTILVTREDDRDATNYLKSLSVSKGKLNFSQYNDNYVVSVNNNQKSVTINAELYNKKSSFVDSYGPRKIELKDEITTALIKVKSETGSIKAYTINFVKNGDETKLNTDCLLSSISLSKAHIAFDKTITDYNTTVDYETDSIDLYTITENGGDSIIFYKIKNGVLERIEPKNILLNIGKNTIHIFVSNKYGKTKTYTINILRKENGLDIASDTSLSMLDIKGYNINFEPNKLDYTLKIKQEKTLLITATPKSNRADVSIRGNDNLTSFTIVKIRVISEDGRFREYTIDIQKDTINKKIEYFALISGVLIIFCGIITIKVKKRRKSINNYYAE